MARRDLDWLSSLASFAGLGTLLVSVGCSAGSSSQGTGGTGQGSNGSGGGTSSGSGGAAPIVDVEPGAYAIAPPNQCKNQFFVEGCVAGDATTACGGVCSAVNACANEGKTGEPGFACPRYLQFSPEMQQAAEDDATRYSWGDSTFNYAVAGHDPDTGGIDAGLSGQPCCQCYQLVFDAPENQAVDQETKVPTVQVPKPLVVQVFNIEATPKTFDLYMGAGGVGARNGCYAPGTGPAQMFTEYPTGGQPSGGGVKAVGEFGNGTACKNQYNLVTEETIGSVACQSLIESTCGQVAAADPDVAYATKNSCIESNKPSSLYHMNWTVYAKRVSCPQALTEVTGCKLVQDGLPAPNASVTTAAQAIADGSFLSGYSTTTMQDCCKPACAWQDKVTGTEGGQTADGLYNSFYTCDANGVPLTE